MVRPIIIEDGERTFYGTREAIFDIPLQSKKERAEFARDLINMVWDINLDSGISDSFYQANIRPSNNRIRIKSDYNELIPFLESPPNIFLNVGDDTLLVNFISTFLSNPRIRRKDRIMEIKGFGVPNDIIKFNPTCLYKFGERWSKSGKPRMGENYDIEIKNFRKIKK